MRRPPISAHVLSLPYYVYRVAGKRWRETGMMLARLEYFLVLCMLAIAGGLALLVNWTALVLLAWNVFRARRNLATAAASVRILGK